MQMDAEVSSQDDSMPRIIAIAIRVTLNKYKSIKKIIKITLITLASISILLAALNQALKYKPIQHYVVQAVISYFSEALKTEITLGAVDFHPFKQLILTDFEIKSRNGKPLFKVEELHAKIRYGRLFSNSEISLKSIALKGGKLQLEEYGDSSNYDFLVAYFNPPKKGQESTKDWITFRLSGVQLADCTFSYYDHKRKKYLKGIDYGNIVLQKITLDLKIKDYASNFIDFDIRKLSFTERSGFQVTQLFTRGKATSKQMEFNDLLLQTPHSTLQDYLLLSYQEIADFKDFIKKVSLKINVSNSHISSKDIAHFATDIGDIAFEASIPRASLSGRVDAIKAQRVTVNTGKETFFKGNFTITGIPEMATAVFDFQLEDLHSSYGDLQRLIPALTANKSIQLPHSFASLTTLNYRGKLKGQYNNFHLTGLLKTPFGEISPTVQLQFAKGFTYEGELQSKGFELGKLFSTTEFQDAAFDLAFKGSDFTASKMALSISGNLHNLVYRKYRYQQLYVEGKLENKLINITGNIDDPNAQVTYHADIDWFAEQPTYALNAAIQHTDLHALKLFNQDSIRIHNAQITTNLQGSQLNTMVGQLNAEKLSFSTRKGDFAIDKIVFTAEGDMENRLLDLKSDVVDARLLGTLDITTISPYFKTLAMRYAPAIGLDSAHYNKQDFDLNLHIKSFAPIASFFDPDLSFDKGAYIKAKFSTENYTAQINAFAPVVAYKGLRLQHVIIDENAQAEDLTILATANRLHFTDATYINNINIATILAKDSLRYNIKLSEASSGNHLDLNGGIAFAQDRPAYINFYPSTILLNSDSWTLNKDAQLKISKGKIYIENLLLKQLGQEVRVDGIASEDNDMIDLKFSNFSLSSLDGLTKPLGVALQGSLNGLLQLNSVFRNPNLSANINTSPILYNKLPIGELRLVSLFDPKTNIIRLDGKLQHDNRALNLYGTYALDRPKDRLQMKAKLNNTDLALFQPFLKSLVTNLTGNATADLTLEGDILKPRISGTSDFRDANFTVNYLNTRYSIHDKAVIRNNVISIADLQIKDQQQHTAVATGTVNLNKLFDPTVDIAIEATNFQVLNTNIKQNNLYYGTAYSTGTFNFHGPASSMAIDIQAKSNENTKLFIPFNNSMTISESDFIQFVPADSSQQQLRSKARNFNGITLRMDLAVTPDAELNINTDLGAVSGKGTGLLTLKISNLGDFEMFGDYHTSAGKFNFKAQEYFNKIFDLKEGGSIRWTGNPSEATVDLKATYQQRTSIAPLYSAAGRNANEQRVLAQADMNIKGILSRPEISFDLNFPQDPYVKDELQGFLSDINNVNQQALSLIIRRSFTSSVESDISKEVNTTLLSAGTEIAFNQLNNLIASSLNMNFLDLNIRSLNDASASLRLFNDRLILTGGVSDRRNLQLTDLNVFSDRVATDAELAYYLRKDGRLMLRASNRLNTRNFLLNPNQDYVTALGLAYRKEFNTFSEYLRYLFWKKSKPQEVLKK